MNELRQRVPNPDDLLRLEPEELAGILLPILKARDTRVSGYSFTNELRQFQEVYPRASIAAVSKAIMEAWNWLVTKGLLAPDPEEGMHGFYFLTRAAHKLTTGEQFADFQKALLLPPKLLHSVVEANAWTLFIRGRYDTAVFEAFKAVEVAVRDACKYEDRIIGIDLMRKAFHPEGGPLSDQRLPAGEREALSALFAGAIGSYKNPTSHRNVLIEDPTEAAEMLILASHLLGIVDERAALQQSL